VNLLVTFLITVTVAIVGVSWIGVIIDKMTSPFISLLIFFPIFFLTIYLCWKLSVKLTEPKTQQQA
jgi:ABC-type dipeptide/oligopeptide/nickel transport system permease component